MNSTFEHKHVITTKVVVTNFAKKQEQKHTLPADDLGHMFRAGHGDALRDVL